MTIVSQERLRTNAQLEKLQEEEDYKRNQYLHKIPFLLSLRLCRYEVSGGGTSLSLFINKVPKWPSLVPKETRHSWKHKHKAAS